MSWQILGSQVGIKILCRCSCGKEQYVNKYNLRDGKTSGCVECAKKRRRVATQTCACGLPVSRRRHARCRKCSLLAKRSIASSIPSEHYVRLANKVKHAIRRCTDRSHPYWMYYGGRGIRVHPAWVENPAMFLAYIAALPGMADPELELDRIDNEGDYEPGNLRFVSHSQSMQNRRPRTRNGDGQYLPSVFA